jgi:hypothetical protein
MNEPELRQLFKNRSDCYADTWYENDGNFVEGDVIQAITEDEFIELLKEAKLLAISDISILHCELNADHEICAIWEKLGGDCKGCRHLIETDI